MVSLRFLLLIVALVLLIVRVMVLLSSYAIACNIDCVQLLKYSKSKAWRLPLHLFRNIGL